MREERAAHASDAPPAGLPAGAPLPVGGVVPEPTKTRNAAPNVSPDAVRAGASGIVTMEFVVTRKGTVDAASLHPSGREARAGAPGHPGRIPLVRSDGRRGSVPPLDQAAVNAVRQWEYTSGVLNGVPVGVVVTVTVSFALRR